MQQAKDERGRWGRCFLDLWFIREYRRGQRPLPWYYGVACIDEWAARAVCYPIPLHLLVRWGWQVQRAWNRWRGRAPTWLHASDMAKQLPREYQRGQDKAYAAGFQAGLIAGDPSHWHGGTGGS